MTPDDKLLDGYCDAGDEGSFRTLVERYLPLVTGTAHRVTGSLENAQDIAQAVFAILARKSGWRARPPRRRSCQQAPRPGNLNACAGWCRANLLRLHPPARLSAAATSPLIEIGEM